MALATSTFPVSGPISVMVRLGRGALAVLARDDLAEATVRLSPNRPGSDVVDKITVEMRGQTLLVEGPRLSGLSDLMGGWPKNHDGVDAEIEVPTGTPVEIASASDSITLSGRCGSLDIATSAPRIDVESVGGHMQLRCGNARTQVGTVSGSAKVRAGSGTAQFVEIGGDLDCNFGNGDITADVVRGDLHSRAGKASARLTAVYGNVDLAFGSGPISIGIPTGVAARLDVISGSGLVDTDLPVEAAPSAEATRIKVKVRTGSGDVHLVRAPAA